MKKLTKTILCSIFLLFVSVNTWAQPVFEKQISEILKASKAGIRTIKGEKSREISKAGVYDCRLPLTHFDTYIDDSKADMPAFVALSNTPAAVVDCNMLVMLPPRGFTVKDSQTDKTVKLHERIKRNVMLVNGNEGTVISMDYLTDNSITITILSQ